MAEFYEPALAQAVCYNRTTYTFSADGLKTTSRGIAGLLANSGRIRLICDHKVMLETHAAIVAGRQQAQAVFRQDIAPADPTAITPDDTAGKQALDLLTWLVAENCLDTRVAIIPNDGIFHDKIGIIADVDGNYIAFHGSLNETRAGANDAERRLYDDIDGLVSEVYASAPGVNPTALGFIMTTYRKRLGSSSRAFAQTCRNHLTRQQADSAAWQELARLNDEELDDDPDAPLPGTTLTPHAMARLEQAAHDAGRLERRDTKLGELRRQLDNLAGAGHRKVIIFTQFRDTMLYLQERLAQHGHRLIVCLSGQDDPAQGSRAQRIKTIRDADAGLLIGTETASESLNLQFSSAMVNYDIPWNSMTLEQRIGRIDRIRQALPVVDIVNLFYADTAEWDAYEAMLERLEAIRDNVGEYQPILYDPASANRMSAIIRANCDRESTRAAVQNIAGSARINLDTLNSTLEQTALPVSAITMADIQRALTKPGLLPEGWAAEHRGGAHWKVTRPDGSSQLVTTDLDAYHYGGANVVWFGPGSPWWPS